MKKIECLRILAVLVGLVSLCSAQRIPDAGEDAFDYCQMKRNFANQLVSKTPPVPQELEFAINAQKDLLIYLDRPEIRALAEMNQSLKSQRADVRFDLARALLIAGRRSEALKTLNELADEAFSGVYAEFFSEPPFTVLKDDREFQRILIRLRSVKNIFDSNVLKTPFQPNIGEDEKIAGLSLFWSKAKYSFVYFDQVPELDWDKIYLEYLPKVRQTKTTYEFYRVLQEICAQLKDGHTNIYLPKALREEMEARPPLRTIRIGDKVFIRTVLSETLKKQGLQIGVEVLKIDGLPVKDYAEKFVEPYQSASTPQDLMVRTYTYALLAGPKDRPLELELKDSQGGIFRRSVPRTGYADVTLPNLQPLEFRVLDGNVGYLALNSFESEKIIKDFMANFEAIGKTDALIIDLRENGGGNSGFGNRILSFLTDRPFQTSRWSSRESRAMRRVSGVQVEWFGGNAETVQPDGEKFYNNSVIVLTSPRTYSAAEDFLVAFDYMKRGKIIGEATGGSTGQPVFFDLPGGGSGRICAKRDTYPDGRKFVGIGIQPNVPVVLSAADFVSGRDTVLETALRELQKR